MRFELTLAGKRLAAAVVVFLAAALALAGAIARGTGAGPVDANATAQAIAVEKDHVTPGELARWILEKRQDYQLIDIREPWRFDDYHIPGAVNIPLPQLFEDSGLKQLSREKKIVIYGFGAGHAAQTQLLLSMKGYKAYSLREGIVQWWEQIMTPLSVRSDDPSPAGYREAKQLREQFLGAPRPPGAMPAPSATPVAPPAQTAPQKAPAPSNRLKLGRGCS
jgi:rhodanese-related sulfurtransferase